MELEAQFQGMIGFISYFGAGFGLTVLFLIIYTAITPQKEFTLIREGNMAAACSLGGSLLGFVLPLSSAIIHSVDFPDMVIWGGVALVVQLAVFFILRLVFRSLPAGIEKGVVSDGVLLGVFSLAVGILNAACMTY
jgi:putative membrane protein